MKNFPCEKLNSSNLVQKVLEFESQEIASCGREIVSAFLCCAFVDARFHMGILADETGRAFPMPGY